MGTNQATERSCQKWTDNLLCSHIIKMELIIWEQVNLWHSSLWFSQHENGNAYLTNLVSSSENLGCGLGSVSMIPKRNNTQKPPSLWKSC